MDSGYLIKRDMGYRGAGAVVSPPVFLQFFADRTDRQTAGGGVCPAPPAPAPRIVEFTRPELYTPTKKIFAKVRSVNMASDLRLYRCDTTNRP